MDSADWNRRYGSEGFAWTTEPNRFVVAEAAVLTPGRALDVACGEGRNAVWLAQSGWRVTGVDFADAGLDKAQRLAASVGVDVAWVCGDIRTWHPEPGTFDLVVLAYVHLVNGERTAVHRALAEGVAAGGTLLVVAHDVTNLRDGHGGPQDPDLLVTPDDLVEDVAGLGFEVVTAARVTRPVATDDGLAAAIDALVVFRLPRSH